MALWEDVWESDVTPVVAIAVGAALVLPNLLPAVLRAGKPVVKAAIKGGLLVYTKGREAFAETGEVAEDIYAEARAELEQGKQLRQEGAEGGKGGPAPEAQPAG
jgi:Protein of unknown function (DUF5132)